MGFYHKPLWASQAALVVKKSACLCRGFKRCGLNPWVGKSPCSRKWQPSSVFLPGGSHGLRNLVGYSPWSQKKSHKTKHWAPYYDADTRMNVCVCVCVCVCSLIMLRKYGSRAITWKFFKTQNWVSFFRNVLAFIQINKWLVMNLVGWWIILIDLLLNYYWIWGWTPFDLPFNMLQSVFANSSFRIFATTHMSAWPPKQLRTFGSWSRAVIIEHTLEQGHL